MHSDYSIIHTTQEKITDNHRFFQRAQKLKEKLGFVTDETLAAAIKISTKTYYTAIKDGKITDKTWRKLQAAENSCNMQFGTKQEAGKGSGIKVMESRVQYGESGGNLYEILGRMEKKIDELLSRGNGGK